MNQPAATNGGRTVLITGGSGFIGLPLVRLLVRAGFRVLSLNRSSQRVVPGAEGVAIDLNDHRAVAELLHAERPEVLVHLAWATDHGRFWHDRANIGWVGSSLHLLEVFADSGGRRFVGLGSCAEYDWDEPGPYKEASSAIAPLTLYGAAKASLRASAELIGGILGLDVAWVRMFHPYGPREHIDRLIPSLIRASMGGPIVQIREPDSWIDPIHVHDAARAVFDIALSDVSGPVNVSGGTPLPIRALVEMVSGLVAARDLAEVSKGGSRVVVADLTRLFQETQYDPAWTLEQGLLDAIGFWAGQAGRVDG